MPGYEVLVDPAGVHVLGELFGEALDVELQPLCVRQEILVTEVL